MKNYYIDCTAIDKYTAIVFSVSYINPLNSIEEINLDINSRLKSPGYLLLDLLLSNGDNFNRFAEVYYDGSKLLLDTASVVSFTDTNKIEKMNTHYRGRTTELSNSVLSIKEAYKYAISNIKNCN